MKRISKCKYIIATHYCVYGAAHALREFLIQNKSNRVLFIAHPLNTGNEKSYIEVIDNGTIQSKNISSIRTRFPIANYLIEILLTLIWVLAKRRKYHLFIGVDNLNTLTGLVLRFLGRVKKVIYYTIDYSPQRFQNKILNYLYHKIDYICVKHADVIWNVSPRIAKGREKIKGINYLDKQKVVSIGIWPDRVKITPFKKRKQHQLVFLGHLLEKQGVQLVIDAIPNIIKKIPDFHFLIIGGGEYESILKNQVKKLKLNKYVTFTGWIKDRQKLDKILSESVCAIAPYSPNNAGFSYYADPTKIKDYLSAGLPVIMTNVSHNAYEIQKNKCGIVVPYEKTKIASAIIKLLSNKELLIEYRRNALKYIKKYDWNRIFDKAFREL